MDEDRVYSVSELNRAARGLLEEGIGAVWVRGEVSNLTYAPSGHAYFTLKDEGSEVSAVRFKGRASLLSPIALFDGQSVLAFGRLTLYEPRGRYQFVVSLLQDAGLGATQLAFERLKEKLRREGLFDPARKRPLPPRPERIGVVTSPTGAALQDLLSVLGRRWPLCAVYVFPCAVQGADAPAEIADALASAGRFRWDSKPLDVLIVGRGGGSVEDLGAFNEERVVRAIAESPVPVVSAVGHEIDVTLADLVADVRAPTPSAAAELVVPDATEILSRLGQSARRSLRTARGALDGRTDTWRASLRGYVFRLPTRMLEGLGEELDLRLADLQRALARAVQARTQALARLGDRLPLVDPLLPLRRGYSLTYVLETGIPLRDASAVTRGDRLVTRLARGRVVSSVQEVIEGDDR